MSCSASDRGWVVDSEGEKTDGRGSGGRAAVRDWPRAPLGASVTVGHHRRCVRIFGRIATETANAWVVGRLRSGAPPPGPFRGPGPAPGGRRAEAPPSRASADPFTDRAPLVTPGSVAPTRGPRMPDRPQEPRVGAVAGALAPCLPPNGPASSPLFWLSPPYRWLWPSASRTFRGRSSPGGGGRRSPRPDPG